MLDLMGVAAKERQRQLLDEAERYRLIANARRELRAAHGRHRAPFSLTTLGHSTGASALAAARRTLTALRELGRDLSAGAVHDPALPQLRDYPVTRDLAPRHRV